MAQFDDPRINCYEWSVVNILISATVLETLPLLQCT